MQGDESRFSTYDANTGRQSMHWKMISSPRQKNHDGQIQIHGLITVFFDICGIFYVDWSPRADGHSYLLTP